MANSQTSSVRASYTLTSSPSSSLVFSESSSALATSTASATSTSSATPTASTTLIIPYVIKQERLNVTIQSVTQPLDLLTFVYIFVPINVIFIVLCLGCLGYIASKSVNSIKGLQVPCVKSTTDTSEITVVEKIEDDQRLTTRSPENA